MVNTCPSQVENSLKGDAGSVYLTPCRAQQSIMDNDGSNGKAWICVLSSTGKGGKMDRGLLSSYYESDNRFRLKIYHHL